MLTQARLKELLTYDLETGIFTYNKTRGPRKKHSIAGQIHLFGYRIICVDYTMYKAHRLAWLYVYGEFPDSNIDIDHINGIRHDNKFSNLRLATRTQNNYNAKLRDDNICGFKGVVRSQSKNRWRARIKVDKKNIHLGYFDSPEKAHNAYIIAAKKYHGEFWRDK